MSVLLNNIKIGDLFATENTNFIYLLYKIDTTLLEDNTGSFDIYCFFNLKDKNKISWMTEYKLERKILEKKIWKLI